MGGGNDMTMLPMYRNCPICKKRYSWNPDVGIMFCPRCKGSLFQKGSKILQKLFKKKK